MKEPLTRIELALIRVFRGTVCPACGQEKTAKQPVCKTCYFALEPKLRNGLHERLDEDSFYDTYLKVIDRLINLGVGKTFQSLPLTARKAFEDAGIADALDMVSNSASSSRERKPAKLWIVLDNGRPLIYGRNGKPALSRKFAEGFSDYELAYKLRDKRRHEYFKLANESGGPCGNPTCTGVICDFHRIVSQANGVTILRVEAK